MATSRNQYFEFLRGLAIVMVVGIHTLIVSPDGLKEAEDIVVVLVRMALNCAVPLFLAISGYFIGSKNISFGKSHIEFLRHQLPKVYIPCLIFSIPYFLIYCFKDSGDPFKGVLLLLTCGFSVYYFVALIIQYYLLLPLLKRMNNVKGLILTALISTISILVVTYALKVLNMNLPLIVYAGPFPLWILFFFIGMYLSSRSRDYGITFPTLLAVAGMILQFLEFAFWAKQGQSALGIKLSSFIFSLGVILLVFSRRTELSYRENFITRSFVYIGGISFGIYLIHCFNILIVSKLPPPIPTASWFLSWAMVLAMSVAIIWLTKLICPRFAKKYLGFR